MTKRKKTCIALACAAVVLILLVYCRPRSLAELGGWDADGEITVSITGILWADDAGELDCDIYTIRWDELDPAAQQRLTDWTSQLRVYRYPLNGRLQLIFSGSGSTELHDGDTEFYLTAYPVEEDGYARLECFAGDASYDYAYDSSDTKFFLPCWVKNGDEVQETLAALIGQYGTTVQPSEG